MNTRWCSHEFTIWNIRVYSNSAYQVSQERRCRNIGSLLPLDAAYLSDYVADPPREPTGGGSLKFISKAKSFASWGGKTVAS